VSEEPEDGRSGPPPVRAGTQDAWLAANIRDARSRAGMSQGEIGRRMKELGWPWSQQTVARTEDGTRKVGAGEAAALARILSSTVDRLLMPGRQASLMALLDTTTARALSAWEQASDWGSELLAAQRQLAVTLREAAASEFAGDPRVAALVAEAERAMTLTPESAAADARAQKGGEP
jgi:transcriptional regulator with XRE-family HTH domain